VRFIFLTGKPTKQQRYQIEILKIVARASKSILIK